MNTLSSYRIGSRSSEANNRIVSSESSILRALFELRKTDIQHGAINDNTQLTFWNCSWSPRILQSLRKILVRDERRFASIKFFDCAIQSDTISSELFAEILGMILTNNSATSLVIKGGRLLSTINDDNSNGNSPLSCGSTLAVSPASISSPAISTALKDGLSTNTSLRSLKVSGLELFSSPSAVTALADALSKNSALESLNLRESSLADISLAQLLRSVKEHPSITVLNLSRNYLGARTKSNAASSSSSASSPVALDAVAEMLRSESSKLESLDLSHQYQHHPTTSPQSNTSKDEAELRQIQQHKAFGKALDALSTNTTLKRIDLSGNPGCLSDPSSTKALASCIVNNTCLEHADVSGCGMPSQSISYLAKECIPFCGTSLKSLVLFGSDKNFLTSPLQNCLHVTAISTTESRCHGDNDSSRASTSAMEKGLLYNITLETLGELRNSDNNGNDHGNIQHILNLNKGGRRAFQQSSSSLPPAAWSHLLARAGNLDYDSHNTNWQINKNNPVASVVFALLRQGPILFEH